MFAPDIWFQQLVLLLSIGGAVGAVMAYLRWRKRLASIRPVLLPAGLFALFGTLDALVTLQGTINAPTNEGNPTIRLFLVWGGWVGQCVGTVLWVWGWAWLADRLGVWRSKTRGWPAGLLGWARLWLLYSLALGHLYGYLSWTDRASPIVVLNWELYWFLWRQARFLIHISPFGDILYSAMLMGAPAAGLHSVWDWGWRRLQLKHPVAPVPEPAQPAQTGEDRQNL